MSSTKITFSQVKKNQKKDLLFNIFYSWRFQ